MNLNQEENEKSKNILQKIKYNIKRTSIQPARLYSSFHKNTVTSKRLKKYNNFEKNTFDSPLGYTFQNSKYFTNKLYLNKQNFIWGKNKLKKENKFYEKEELFERLMRLQNKVNFLNNQNNEQKIEINKQKLELIKQNKILNEVNTKIFFNRLLENEEDENNKSDQGSNLNNENEIHIPLSKKRSHSTEELDKNYNKIYNKLLDKLNNNNLKELYKKLLKQNDIKEKEIIRLKQKIDSIKFSNETLISNMKLKYKELQSENNKKIKEFQELKKSSKCTKYNEIMREKEIYEKEMLNIKNKFYQTLEVLQKYKNCFKENELLKEELNKKNIKISNLESEILLFSENSEKVIENLKKEIKQKNKKIQKLENEIKKYILNNQNEYIPKEEGKIKKLKITNRNKLFYNKYDINNYNSNNKTQNLYINHCLNFSKKDNKKNNNSNNDILYRSPSSHSSRINLFSASWNNINIKKEKIVNIKNNENIINKNNSSKDRDEKSKINSNNNKIQEIINLYPELFQLYIEMKKRNIIDNKIFINEVLLKLKENNSNNDNKNIYYNSIIKLFNIEDENGKKIIENLTNKEFDKNKSIEEIKSHQIKILNELFNQKSENEDDNKIFEKKLGEMDINKLNSLIYKYDDCESGFVFFNQMISIVNDLKMKKYLQKILLLTKESEAFDLMNYNNILNMIKDKKEKSENNNNLIQDNNRSNNGNTENLNSIKNDNNDIPNNNKKEKIKDKNNDEKNKNESSSLKNIEKEFINSEEKNINIDQEKNAENVENILKKFAHMIIIEGSTPNIYIRSLKEIINIGENNNSINVINPENLFNFLKEKNLSLSKGEKDYIIRIYGIKIEDKNIYIDHDKLVDKIFEYIKTDEGNSNDEDFMKNIKSIDIEGID